MLQLKDYQEKVLETLSRFFRACDEYKDASLAFYKVTQEQELWKQGIPYWPIKEPSELADIPYVCLRLPTGGGKTLLACHSLAVANREFLKQDHSLVLWLVPSNAIREQTLKALNDRTHFYRQALSSTLGNVVVMDLTEALYLQKGVLLDATVIVVSTIQAFRVEDKEGRKVYENAGALRHHFDNLPAEIKALLDKDENGVIPNSLANVMRLHRPLVIVDEAHNARTELSFDMLGRFRPSAIIEFTATPDSKKNPSNVLHSVAASELKAESMIKLPIRLEAHNNWQPIISDAIAQRNDLEKKAIQERLKTGDYIRPIMLIQAQNRNKDHETLTVEVIEKSLMEDHHIPVNHIVRATGDDRGLDGVDLSEETCEIRYVITVQALREGWDCPFAYVLCSVAEQHAAGAVEQILGRILRLPYARERAIRELNFAYAFVTSPGFDDAAQRLKDGLVENHGFNRQEAGDFIKTSVYAEQPLPMQIPEKISQPITITLSEVPDPEQLSPELRQKIDIDTGKKTITFKTVLEMDEEKAVRNLLSVEETQKIWSEAVRKSNSAIKTSAQKPSERGVVFQVPGLSIQKGVQLELFEENHLLEDGWDVTDYDPRLTPSEFDKLMNEDGQFGEIDVSEEGRVKTKFIQELNHHLKMIEPSENWTDAKLIDWMDRNLYFKELSQEDKQIFLTALTGDLLDNRGLNLGQLVRKKHELRKIAETKITGYRKEARTKIYQQLLFGESSERIITSPEACFSYRIDQYPARFYCPASDTFRNHYFPKVGELQDKGEEFLCAQFIDRMPEMDFWVRNMERQERYSFWLQTATDKFYPDFVCKLKDGRFLVVEYKGADRWSNDDSKEKRRLGELWALKSNGKCLFVMPKGKDWNAIRTAVKSREKD